MKKMNQYIARVKGLYNQVNNSACKLENGETILNERLLIVAVIRGLSVELQGEFRRWDKKDFNLGVLESKLVAEEYCQTNYILQAGKVEKKRERKEITCYWCKEIGHVRKDCAKYKSRKTANLCRMLVFRNDLYYWLPMVLRCSRRVKD